MGKKLAGFLACMLLVGAMPVLAAGATGNGFVFANTKGLLIGDFYSETQTALKPAPPASQEEPMQGNGTVRKDEHGIGTDDTKQSVGNGGQTQSPAPAPADYDNVEMGDNMMQATVDGSKMTFYLESAGSASDGYELRYISFTPEGEPRYQMYLRIPLGASAGSYSSGEAYFSLSASYNEEKDQWGSSYKALYDGKGEEGKHGSSSFTGNWGSYRLSLDQDMGWEEKEISGTLTAVLDGFSSATKGKTISVDGGTFRAVKGEMHETVQNWQSGGLASRTGGWTDPYAGANTQEKKTCGKCGGNGRVICSYCDGAGTLLQRKEGIDLGSGSTGYTVEVDCRACDGGYVKCSRCGGSGYE